MYKIKTPGQRGGRLNACVGWLWPSVSPVSEETGDEIGTGYFNTHTHVHTQLLNTNSHIKKSEDRGNLSSPNKYLQVFIKQDSGSNSQ